MRLVAMMENASWLSDDVWNNVTSSSLQQQPDDLTSYLAYIRDLALNVDNLQSKVTDVRDLALKVIYIILGTVGIIDNLFVLVVFFLFIKITEKVLQNFQHR